MTTGELLVVRAAMKPLATLNRAGRSRPSTPSPRSRRSVQGAHRRHRGAGDGRGRRDDGRARAGRRGAAQVRRRLASPSSCATPQPFRARPALSDGAPMATDDQHLVLVGLMGAGKTTVGARRRRAARPAAGRQRRSDRGAHRPHGAGDLRDRRRGGVPRARDRGAVDALAERRAAGDRRRRRRGAARGEPRRAAARRAPRSCGCAPTRPCSSSGRRRGQHRPLLDDDPAGSVAAHARPSASRCTAVAADRRRRHRPPRSRRRRRRGSSSRWSPGCAASPCRSASAATTCSSATARDRELRRAAAADGAARGRRHPGGHPARRRPGHRRRACSRSATARRTRRWPRSRTLCRGFARIGLTRNDVVIGVGGGMVTDVAGFAAAVLAPRRPGRPRGHDAARHGRRRDRRQDRRQPAGGQEPGRRVLAAAGVICDLDALATLPPRERRCGRRRDGQVPLPHRRRPAGDGR